MVKNKIEVSSLKKLLRTTIYKRGSFLDRAVNLAVLRMIRLFKALSLPPSLLPSRLKGIHDYWTSEMIDQFISSKGLKLFHDIPAKLIIPQEIASKIECPEQFSFSKSELESFYRDGFIGPFEAISPSAMENQRDEFYSLLESKHKMYGFVTDRDRHLVHDFVLDLFKRPEIVERCAQLLGPNLMIWRSHFFNKQPGSPAIPWHQAVTYLFEDFEKPSVVPPSFNELFQLTVWIAVDPSTVENGCIQFIPGTHTQLFPVILGEGDSFGTTPGYRMEGIEDRKSKAIPMEMKPGQFVIFTERVIHGSKANDSLRPRMGLNMRVVRTDTKLYPGKKKQLSLLSGEDVFDLKDWGVVMLRGEDNFNHNPIYKQSLSRETKC